MSVTQKEVEELKQTGTLLALGNFLLWPFYAADRRLGVTASIVATLAAVGALYHVGKDEKAKATPGHNRNGLFSSTKTDDPIKDAFDTVLSGGAKVAGLLTHSAPRT